MTAVAELPNGAEGVEVLSAAAIPCPVSWCTGCNWEFDTVGGALCRAHSWETDHGILVSVIDYPPGDPRNDDIEATEPLIAMPQPRSDAHNVEAATAIYNSLGHVLSTLKAGRQLQD